VEFSRVRLTSLEGAPEVVYGNFRCDYNRLTSLNGAPKEVHGNFWCDHNKLESLEGIINTTANGSFACYDNPIKIINYVPKGIKKLMTGDIPIDPELKTLLRLSNIKVE
jgi:hypothetical protein